MNYKCAKEGTRQKFRWSEIRIRNYPDLYKSASGVVMVRDRALVIFLKWRGAIAEQVWSRLKLIGQPEVAIGVTFLGQPPLKIQKWHFFTLSVELVLGFSRERVGIDSVNYKHAKDDTCWILGWSGFRIRSNPDLFTFRHFHVKSRISPRVFKIESCFSKNKLQMCQGRHMPKIRMIRNPNPELSGLSVSCINLHLESLW